MGRAFEYRKARMFKRWDNMAKTFTKLGREIAVAARDGGADPQYNSRLRILIQNAKAVNMPKDTIERSIKRAVSKDADNFKEMVYQGYGPYGVAIIVETSTDNSTRTVANVRSYFNKAGGALGITGSLDFMFDHKSHFKIAESDQIDIEELELELIDYGVDEVFLDEGEINVYGEFESYHKIQTYFEERGVEIISGDFDRLPNDMKTVNEEQRPEIDKLVERLEEDDDVVKVYHNMS